jgi:UDP-N-acetyl-D-galactosamine dehydrogenase
MKKILPAIIGLGYVGLPIFLRLKRKFCSVGFDINKKRINQLKNGFDINREYKSKYLKLNNQSIFTSDLYRLKKCNFFIITVPTPITKNKKPDLKYLIKACKLINKILKDGDIIFFESTVYPGLTRYLKNKYLGNKKDICIGYSPERINPGDNVNTIQNIAKIVAYDKCPKETEKIISNVYSIVSSKIVFSKSIENAEMSKVIENIQRDINIAFMNEIFMVSQKLNLDFAEVIKLAKTKWNFLNFSPGLVGGHCLPIDPYYLYYLAKKNKHNAQFMLSGRNVNDELAEYIKKKIFNLIKSKEFKKILILGISYKANVADLRNSLALKIFKDLKKKFPSKIFAYDPIIDKNEANNLKIINKIKSINNYDLIVPLTNHKEIKKHFSKHYKKNKIKYLDFFNHFRK